MKSAIGSEAFSRIREGVSFELLFGLYLFAGVYKCTPIVAAIPGNLTVIFVVSSFFVAVWLSIHDRIDIRHEGVIVTILMAIFVVYTLISFVWSPGGAYAHSKALRLATTTPWALAGTALVIASDRRRIRRFFTVAVILALAAATVTFINVARPSSETFGANYIILGRIIGFGAVIVTYRLQTRTQTSEIVTIRAGLLVVFAAALVVGGSRAALGTTVVAVVVVWAGTNVGRDSSVPSVVTYAAVGSVGLGAVIVWATGWIPRTLFRIVTVSTAPGSSLGARLGYWHDSVAVLGPRIFLGYGLGSWPTVTHAAEARWPHNAVLEVLVEFGLVGLVLLTLVVGAALAVLTRRSPRGSGYVLLVTLLVFTGLNALVSGDLNGNRYLFAVLGLLVAPRLDF